MRFDDVVVSSLGLFVCVEGLVQIVSPVKVIAACAALGGFSVAMLAGLAADNPADVILGRAVAALFVCYAVGALIGFVMDQAVSEGLREYKEEHSLPIENAGSHVNQVDGETRSAA